METLSLRALKRFGVELLFNAFWWALISQPFFASRLWGYWWLRPIIVWYLPLTLVSFTILFHFLIAIIFCLLIKGGKHSALRPFVMKFQGLVVYIFFKVMNGMEVHGVHNLPKGGGLLVYFHAPFAPVDKIFLFSYVFLKFGRIIGGVIQRHVHEIPFLAKPVELYDLTSDRETIIEDLRNGQLRSVAPGGAYEAIFSKNYSVEWKSRIGFAKIAKMTGVPVVPMFTTNIQQAIPLIDLNRSDMVKELYADTKRPICVPKGYIPVKTRIYLGEPLTCGKDEEPEVFAQRVKKAIEHLRDKHQSPHQTLLGALRERLW